MRRASKSPAARLLLSLLAVLVVSVLGARTATAQQTRPIDQLFRGVLLICGGGGVSAEVKAAFVEQAGGKAARIVIVPTASANADRNPEKYREFFAEYQVDSIRVLHTRDREVANGAEFVAPLLSATGVWIPGGQQSRLSAAYHGTAVETALRALLARGGIIGGSSAGAAIQTSIMIAGGKTEPKLSRGFDLLPGCIVDQHFTQRSRLPRLAAAVQANPTMVGVGVDEKTALWVRGRGMTVLGTGTVSLVFAATKYRPGRVDVLRAKDVTPDFVATRRAAQLRGSGEDHAFEPGKPHVAAGTLIMVGGGGMPLEAWIRFLREAGGAAASIVVIPTAVGSTRGAAMTVRLLRGIGAKKVTLLHESDRKKIDDEKFLAPLREATGIWFGGGRQWRLVDAYEGTKALALFHDVLKRGGVIAGSSAGTSIQGEFMVRGNPRGNVEAFVEGYEKGFGFLPGAGIDQHFTQRDRHEDLAKLVQAYPRLLGIGIDEDTAIVVQKSGFDVIGDGDVFVRQNGKSSRLAAGDRYDMAAGQPVPRDPGEATKRETGEAVKR